MNNKSNLSENVFIGLQMEKLYPKQEVRSFIGKVSNRVLHEKGVDINDILQEEAGDDLI